MYVYIIYEMTKDKFPGEHHLVLIWNVKHTSWKDLLVRDVMTPTFQAETIKWNGHWDWLAGTDAKTVGSFREAGPTIAKRGKYCIWPPT